MTSDEDRDAAHLGMAQALMEMRAMMEPIIEAADGLKLELLGRGWSPEIAQLVAGEMMVNVIRLMMKGTV